MELRKYLDENNLSILALCKGCNMSNGPIHRVLKGLPINLKNKKKLEKFVGFPLNIQVKSTGPQKGSSWKKDFAEDRYRTYNMWYRIYKSCTDPSFEGYKRNRNRGICSKWHTFEGFVEDMGYAKPFQKAVYISRGNHEYNVETTTYVESACMAKRMDSRGEFNPKESKDG